MLSVITDVYKRDATDYKFWCHHHREAAKWLAIRIHQVLVEGKEDIKPILLASLPVFLEEYAVPSQIRFPAFPAAGEPDES